MFIESDEIANSFDNWKEGSGMNGVGEWALSHNKEALF